MKFSNSQVKKWSKFILIVFVFTQYIQMIIISTCNQNRCIIVIFLHFLWFEILRVFHIYSISQFRLAPLETLSSHLWQGTYIITLYIIHKGLNFCHECEMLFTKTILCILDPRKIHLHQCSPRTSHYLLNYWQSEKCHELFIILSFLIKILKTFSWLGTTTSFFLHSFLGEGCIGEHMKATLSDSLP